MTYRPSQKVCVFGRPCESSCFANFLKRFDGKRRNGPPPPGIGYRRPFTRNSRNPMFAARNRRVVFDTRKRYTFSAFASISGFREKMFHFNFPNRSRPHSCVVRPVVFQAPTANVTSLLYTLSTPYLPLSKRNRRARRSAMYSGGLQTTANNFSPAHQMTVNNL